MWWDADPQDFPRLLKTPSSDVIFTTITLLDFDAEWESWNIYDQYLCLVTISALTAPIFNGNTKLNDVGDLANTLVALIRKFLKKVKKELSGSKAVDKLSPIPEADEEKSQTPAPQTPKKKKRNNASSQAELTPSRPPS